MLSLDNISVTVGNFRLRQINMTVERGDYFVVLGPSGVGKSLLLETIAGLRRPDSGVIRLRGTDITKQRIQKRRISIVYQDADLFPHLTVFENIAYPLRSKREEGIEEKVVQAAGLTGVIDKLSRKPGTLSGGEYQRVSLARSIVADSDIVLLDEPLSSIDTKARAEMLALLRSINRKGITVVHVTHDYEEAISVATKIGVMEHGEMVHIATPEAIFRHPKSEFVAHFVGVKNFFRGTLRRIARSQMKSFTTNGLSISCLTDAPGGDAFLLIGPEEISISAKQQPSSSRNNFRGTIKDVARARLGYEVTVDVGTDIVAIVTGESKKSLGLSVGKRVWLSFKASSCKIYRSDEVKT